jgi:hypothetical protein
MCTFCQREMFQEKVKQIIKIKYPLLAERGKFSKLCHTSAFMNCIVSPPPCIRDWGHNLTAKLLIMVVMVMSSTFCRMVYQNLHIGKGVFLTTNMNCVDYLFTGNLKINISHIFLLTGEVWNECLVLNVPLVWVFISPVASIKFCLCFRIFFYRCHFSVLLSFLCRLKHFLKKEF